LSSPRVGPCDVGRDVTVHFVQIRGRQQEPIHGYISRVIGAGDAARAGDTRFDLVLADGTVLTFDTQQTNIRVHFTGQKGNPGRSHLD